MRLYTLASDGSRTQEIAVSQKENQLTAVIDSTQLKAGATPYFEWLAQENNEFTSR